jgi:hypothetical protein
LHPNVHRNGTSNISFDSAYFSFLFPTSQDENEISKGANHFGNLLSSIDMFSFHFNGTFCKKENILSSSGKT